jgi:hypothetical protein
MFARLISGGHVAGIRESPRLPEALTDKRWNARPCAPARGGGLVDNTMQENPAPLNASAFKALAEMDDLMDFSRFRSEPVHFCSGMRKLV